MKASKKIARASLFRFIVAFVCFFSFSQASAHEPITTKVRFNKEVVRVLERSCLGCHRPGGIAPMSLATYEEARPWAKAIKEEMLEKRMPPWRAVKGYGEFRNAPLLTQREIDLVVNWVEGGAPKGDDKDLPDSPLFSDDWSLGKPDLILKPESRIEVAPDADEWREFVLPTGLKKDQWLAAIDLRPGNGSVVHCAIFYLDKGKGQEAASREDEPENKNASTRIKSGARANAFLPDADTRALPSDLQTLGTWMPGQKAMALPDGIAQLISAGSRVVARIHYRGSDQTSGEATKDHSAVGLYFAAAPVRKQAREISIGDPAAIIPAGVVAHPIKASVVIEYDAEAIAIRPRAHRLVISFQATAYRPDGAEEVLIWTRGAGFDWQPTYYFKRPVALPKGTRIEVIGYLDNSEGNQNNSASPPRQARWSDLSGDPLCSLLTASNR